MSITLEDPNWFDKQLMEQFEGLLEAVCKRTEDPGVLFLTFLERELLSGTALTDAQVDLVVSTFKADVDESLTLNKAEFYASKMAELITAIVCSPLYQNALPSIQRRMISGHTFTYRT
jgi:hypothetical protein